MSETEVRTQAIFDQANASSRDAMESIRKVDRGLFLMTPEERKQFVGDWEPWRRELAMTLAVDAGIARLVDLLAEEGESNEG